VAVVTLGAPTDYANSSPGLDTDDFGTANSLAANQLVTPSYFPGGTRVFAWLVQIDVQIALGTTLEGTVLVNLRAGSGALLASFPAYVQAPGAGPGSDLNPNRVTRTATVTNAPATPALPLYLEVTQDFDPSSQFVSVSGGSVSVFPLGTV
jgi:hypothetical protein